MNIEIIHPMSQPQKVAIIGMYVSPSSDVHSNAVIESIIMTTSSKY